MAAAARLTTTRLAHDPLAHAAKVVGKKWYLVILHELAKSPRGFNDLKRAVGGISAKVLSESLAELEARGFVVRRVASESPIRVEYSATAKAADLADVFAAMRRWGERWTTPVEGAFTG